MNEYLVQRFLNNNHPKYYKYCNLWIDRLTKDQINYFIEERRRLYGIK